MVVPQMAQLKFNKYKVMRSLYLTSKSYDELVSETDIEERKLNTALTNLLSNTDIKKKKITEEQPPPVDEKQIQADLLGIKTKPKTTYYFMYELTKKGYGKLVYFEIKYQAYKLWHPPSEEGSAQEKYVEEIAQYVSENKEKYAFMKK